MENQETQKEVPVTIAPSIPFSSDGGSTREHGDSTINLSPDSDIAKKIIESAVSQSRHEFFVTFGVFASLITFVSIQIQIFSKIEGVYNLLGIASFTLGGLLLFAIVLNNLSIKNFNNKDFVIKIKEMFCNPAIILCIIFLLTSIFFLHKQEQLNNQNLKTQGFQFILN
ncbi:MAG: hypothetical protein WCG28_01800 [bacterium]